MGWLEGSGGGSSGGCWLLAWWLEARGSLGRGRPLSSSPLLLGEAASAHTHTHTRKELGDAASLGSPPGTPHNRGHAACENENENENVL